MEEEEERSRLALRAPDGELVPDERGPSAGTPAWASDPFAGDAREPGDPLKGKTTSTLFGRGFLVYEALSQRGKGGVYRALDVRRAPARIVILKEGRRHGETGWDGRDGAYRVRRDAKVMEALKAAGLRVPDVYAKLRVGQTAYVAMEHIEGSSVQSLLGGVRLGVDEALRLASDIASVVGKVHTAGWVWRDCKPANLMLVENGVVPVDFEGAAPRGARESVPWTTPGYLPPELVGGGVSECRESDDVYALGVTVHQLLSGEPQPERPLRPIGSLRRGVPKRVRELIARMLSSEAATRPGAEDASRVLAG
jgi:serine/threonine protein kinase